MGFRLERVRRERRVGFEFGPGTQEGESERGGGVIREGGRGQPLARRLTCGADRWRVQA